jgi:rod shape-determining protein MreD
VNVIRWNHVVVVLTAASVLQTAIFDQVLLADRVRVDLLLLIVLGVGHAADRRSAVLLGFVTGLAIDLFRTGPFGLHALLYCLAGWVLVQARERMLMAGTSYQLVQGAIAAAVLTAAVWTAAAVFGQSSPPFTSDTLTQLAWIGLVGGLLVKPADRVAAWMLDARRGAAPRSDLVRVE